MAVVEEGMIGGSSINIACIPAKALIQSARLMHAVRSADATTHGTDDKKVNMKKCIATFAPSLTDGQH
ncbi:PF00070 family, FAD-dependent NAD(P)-disulfide oxidoreductase [Caballeronia sordidicola]|uniref:PF00070 family, FAD-dependent NAD(P)-disulfide oxidoreductase n=1 Tax=Caballeronia sordidicola TaxID=196367 RepID=A0A242M5K4_CABSO|nr:PF00070 family, FAD-dependent NAD(P)-disulfide oxidoreductase [Caballeronia sordidicola]